MAEPGDAAGSVTPPLSPEEGHSEFRSLIFLFTLVAAINNNGHASLKQPYDEDYVAPLELTQHATRLDKRLLLGAFAAIFVRDYEVVAVAASEQPNKISVSSAGHPSSGVYQVLAMQDEPACAIQGEYKYRELHVEKNANITGLTTIGNPRGRITRLWERQRKPGGTDNGRGEEGDMSANSEGPPYTLAPKGHSHFDAIFDGMSNWSWLDAVESQNNPLHNHIATISAYYRACIASNTHTASDTADREIYLYSDFTRYIVASCWRKMNRRITHWSSLGFLHNLGNLSEEWLRTMFQCHSAELSHSSRRDNALWNELRALQTEGMLREVMDYHPTKSTPEPTRLIAALREVKEAPGEVVGLGAYTEETCFELHQLLIAALFGYGHALKMLGDKQDLPCTERVTYIQMVAQFGNLLWRIVYSRILGHHLTLLQLGSFLSIHNRDGEEHFRKYASFAPQFKRRPMDFEEQLALNIDSDEVSGDDHETEAIKEDEGDREVEAENVGETEKEQQDDDEDTGEELRRMIDEVLIKKLDNDTDAKKRMGDNTMTGMGLLFQRWLRLLVNHWAALDIISSHASKSSHDIRIKLITARHPDTYADQGMKMNHWQDTIRRLSTYVTSHPQSSDPADTFNAEVCISMLETHLKNHKAPHHAHKTALNYEPENPNKFASNYHCETLLAAIIHSGVHAPEESERFLGENWNRHIIVVSKLCCFVCWDVLTILRMLGGNSQDFVVRGRHTTLFAIDLPHWLPESVVVQMVGLYRNRLLKELVTMMKRKRTYSDTPLQSDGAFSLPSNESVDDPPRRPWWRVVPQ